MPSARTPRPHDARVGRRAPRGRADDRPALFDHEHPGISDEAWARYEEQRRHDDAAPAVRVRRRTRPKKRSPYPLLTVAVVVVGLSIIAWMLSWDGDRSSAASTPAPDNGLARVQRDAPPAEPEREPTPLFAEQGGTPLHLAVDPSELTALAFHQASGANALHIGSLVPDADMALAAQLHAAPGSTTATSTADGVWGGACLRLWRSNRSGQPDTAIDTGAEPGTAVWSPVTGTVLDVVPYLLYDKHEDFEIHIKPEGRDDVDVVLIHVQDVVVKPGDRVKGGVTRLASVRRMSDKIDIQLGGYTANGGDHVHIQLNRIAPTGALEPSGGS